MQTIGEKTSLCFEISDKKTYGLLPINIYAADTSLISGDNHIHVGSFLNSLMDEKALIEQDDIPENYEFFKHSNVLDGFKGGIQINGDSAHMQFRFMSGIVLEVELPTVQLLRIYDEAITFLQTL